MPSELTHLSSSELTGLIGLGDPMHRAPQQQDRTEPASHLEPQASPGQIAYVTAEIRGASR